MANFTYKAIKQTDPFGRYFGYGQTQDHTYPFWTGPHAKIGIAGNNTQTQTGQTITEGLELCCEISSAAGGTYDWTCQILVDGVIKKQSSAVNRTNMILIYFKWGVWHTYEGHPDDWQSAKSKIDTVIYTPKPRPFFFEDFSSRKIGYKGRA